MIERRSNSSRKPGNSRAFSFGTVRLHPELPSPPYFSGALQQARGWEKTGHCDYELMPDIDRRAFENATAIG
jgi:hypothetical protein